MKRLLLLPLLLLALAGCDDPQHYARRGGGIFGVLLTVAAMGVLLIIGAYLHRGRA